MAKSGFRISPSFLSSVPHAMGPPLFLGLIVYGGFRISNVEPDHRMAWTGLALAATGAALIILLHFLIPWDPNDRFVSDYARDHKFGFLMDWAFAVLGLGSICLGRAIHVIFGDSRLNWILYVAGALIALLSVFVCDAAVQRAEARLRHAANEPDLPPPTFEGRVHDIFVTIAFFAYIVGMLWFCFDPGPDIDDSVSWLVPASFSLFNVALICATAYVVMGVRDVADAGKTKRPLGLPERIVILCLFEWVGVLALALLSTSAS